MKRLLKILVFVTLGQVYGADSTSPSPTSEIEQLRLAGDLVAAQALAENALDQPSLPITNEIGLRLELAKILDRVGLHQNTRPVVESLEQIETAQQLLGAGDIASRARVELALADYFYRAEMTKREFPQAESHARLALSMFEDLGDGYGQADAVHRLGLIELQRRNLTKARLLFDRSIELDLEAGGRVFFTGEYERHVAFVLYLSGEKQLSVPYYERSLSARRAIRAEDPAMFAAISLASVLVELDRLGEALPYLEYSVFQARKMNSPVALARAQLAFGQYFTASGNSEAAHQAFNESLDVSQSVHLQSTADRAREALAKL